MNSNDATCGVDTPQKQAIEVKKGAKNYKNLQKAPHQIGQLSVRL